MKDGEVQSIILRLAGTINPSHKKKQVKLLALLTKYASCTW
jgi:hypothetical protein